MKSANDEERLLSELNAWIDFYRDLGIMDLYLPPVGGAQVSEVSSAMPPAASAASPSPASATAAGRPERPSEWPAPPLPPIEKPMFAPAAAPRSMGLFDASPASRVEHETLEQIRADLGDCHRCRLAEGRKTIVFGQGNPHAELVFVGEGPGADEDEQGLPFVGRAGQLLNRMIQRVGMKREEVYICNVVKCRPPGNRTPLPDEIETCSPFLFRQIAAIRPRLVCCLGAPAVRTLLGIKEGITKIRGRFYDFGNAKALATVHPAYILRNPREEKILHEDFEKIRDFLSMRR